MRKLDEDVAVTPEHQQACARGMQPAILTHTDGACVAQEFVGIFQQGTKLYQEPLIFSKYQTNSD